MVGLLGALAFTLEPMYDYVTGANAKGELENSSGVATSWEISPDGKTWSFKFRSGVVFHNGDPVTSQDVLRSLEFVKGVSTAAAARRIPAIVASMETPDERSLIIKLKGRDIFFAHTYFSANGNAETSFVLPMNYLTRVGLESFNKAPSGSGPYKFKDNRIGDRIVYEALDKHWYYGIPKYKLLSFIHIPEEATRLALLQTGEIELTEVGRDGAKRAEQAAMRIKERAGGATLHLRLHDQWVPGNPLGNPKVRKALDISIDRKAIVGSFLGGRATPTIQHRPSPIDLAFEPLPVPPQDLGQAKQLLKEAGYPDGFVLNYVIHETVGVPEGLEIAEAIAVWWEQIGVKVKRSNLAYATVLQKWVAHTFEVPTATCCPVRVNLPIEPNPGGVLTEGNIYRLGYAPEIEAVGAQVGQASSIEEYIQLTREWGRGLTEFSIVPSFAYLGTLYALRPAIGGETWQLGVFPSSIRVLELVRR